jgi:hypothetical protein
MTAQPTTNQIIEQHLRSAIVLVNLLCGVTGDYAPLSTGLARTSGKYFAYLGSDYLWLPTFLQRRTQLLESRNEAVLVTLSHFQCQPKLEKFGSWRCLSSTWFGSRGSHP